MKIVSKRAEDLLREILEHRDEKGNCDTDYWKDRFGSYSVAEDALVRSLFKELREAEMISVSWADNYPYILLILGNGLSYFEEKNDGRNGLGGNSYTNNFYGNTNGIQIQQGTTNSTQTQAVPHLLDAEQVDELIRMIKKYDAVLDNEYGADEADKVREAANELEAAVKDGSSPKRAMGILSYIRDLSVNAGGGLLLQEYYN